MQSKFDASEFVDTEFHSDPRSTSPSPATPAPSAGRPPSREDLDNQSAQRQQRLSELKRLQDELERERAALEEAKRRRIEFTTGRQEMIDHLTRGVGLLEESEFAARRDAEQMGRSLLDIRDALAKVQNLREDQWTEENWSTELTRGLTTLENARMEWNGARLRWPVLDGKAPGQSAAGSNLENSAPGWMQPKSFLDLCKLGLALNWPVALGVVMGFIVLVVLLVRR